MASNRRPEGFHLAGAQLFLKIGNRVDQGWSNSSDRSAQVDGRGVTLAPSGVDLAQPGNLVLRKARYSQLLAVEFQTSPRTVDRILTIRRYGDSSILTDLAEGRISINNAYRRSLHLRDLECATGASGDPLAGDLGQTLLAFIKSKPREEKWVRVWTNEERDLLSRLVHHLHSNRCLSDGQLTLLQSAIAPKGFG